MADESKCLKCGAPLDGDAWDGVCPRCLLTQALGGNDSGLNADAALTSPLSTTATPDASQAGRSESGWTLKPGDRIGRYKILRKIGESGCGLVFQAEQEEPVRRLVALKIIKLGMDTREVVARFEAERQALALMDHPNIAKVFDGGVTGEEEGGRRAEDGRRTPADAAQFRPPPSIHSRLSSGFGRPYFVMELVPGLPITEFCDQANLSTRQRLDLFLEVCSALEHAHQKGVIHRDIKPSNVLVTRRDGVPVPKVIDFGIAKATQGRLADRTIFTAFERFIGTPAYMSPEQAQLGGQDVDTRTDIYSLGVLLYELLAGRPPFDPRELAKAGLDEIRRIIREVEPPKPSTRLTTLQAADQTETARRRQTEPPKLVHQIRGDLDWIVMKALEKDRARRYASASALAEDLRRHLTHRPVEASPPSWGYRVSRFTRRNRVWVGSGALVALVLVLASVVSLRLAFIANRERNAAERNAAAKREQLVRLEVANGVRALENRDWFGSLLWFAEALRQDQADSSTVEMQRYRIGALLPSVPRLTRAWFQGSPIRNVGFSPDGAWAVTSGLDKTVRLWNVQSGLPGPVLSHETNVNAFGFDADGRRLLTLSGQSTLSVWDAAKGRIVCPPWTPGYMITKALISPDGRRVYTSGDARRTNGMEYAWTDPVTSEGAVGLWDAATGRAVRAPFRSAKSRISDLVLSSDGQWLAAGPGESVMVWNLRRPGAVHLLGGAEGKAVLLPGLESNPPPAEMETLLPDIPTNGPFHSGNDYAGLTALALSPDGRRVATAYADGLVRVWSLPGGTPLTLNPSSPRPTPGWGSPFRESLVQFIAFSPDGQRVLGANHDGRLQLWNARTGETEGRFQGDGAESVRFSPDGRLALLGGRIWNLGAGQDVFPRPLHAYLRDAVFSPDGSSLLTAGLDGSARLWNLASELPFYPPFRHDWPTVVTQKVDPGRAEAGNLREHADQTMLRSFSGLSHAAFSPDGRLVVTASLNGSARVWNAKTGEALTPFVTLDVPLDFADFNREATRFVTVGGWSSETGESLARVWNTRTGQPISAVLRVPFHVEAAVFSPDGRWLILATESGVDWRDAGTGLPADIPFNRGEPFRALAFSPDGRLLAACEPRPVPDTKPSVPARTPASPEADHFWQTRIWNIKTGQPATPPFEETNEVTRLEFSPDGRWVLTFASAKRSRLRLEEPWTTGAIRLWETATGRAASPHLGPGGFNPKAVFSRDGRRLYLVRPGTEPILWDFTEGKILDSTPFRGFKLHPFDVTADGRLVAVNENREVRLHDAVTGELLTPPFPTNGKVYGIFFSPDGSSLLVLDDERAQLWPLPKETRSVEELVSLAQLLSGRKIDVSGNYVEWTSEAADQAWRALRSKYPQSFEAPPVQVRRWRERIVEACERREQWFGALFHLDRLVQQYPDDQSLRLRRARARDHLALDELK
jgi:eukaryotic-like serine/threonine-protein kinase